MLLKRVVPISSLVVLGIIIGTPETPLAQSASPNISQIEFAKLQHKPIAAFPGVSNMFITGAFNKAGLYAAHGKMAKGTTFPPHKHPDMRLSVVTSGTMYLAQGKTFDEAKLVAYPAGTMAITPANTYHYMYAKDGDVTIMEIGSGPSGMDLAKQ